MIREVLPSDVEFARGLVTASHSDAEILAVLQSRGVDPGKAAQLVDDLRHGRAPSTQLPFERFGGVPPPARKPLPAKAAVPEAPALPRHRPHRRLHRHKGSSWWLLILLIIFAWAFGYAFLHVGSDASQDAIQKGRHEIPPAPNKE